MKLVIWLLFTACLGLTACTRVQTTRPEDFSLILDWDTGALPPPYHYSYVISIGPSAAGWFTFQPGYAPENSGKLWETEFELQDTDLDVLYLALVEKEALRSNWSTGEPLMGGQGSSIVITAGGKEYKVPSLSILTRSDREKVQALIEIIRGYVPKSIWDEMAMRQAEFESGYEN